MIIEKSRKKWAQEPNLDSNLEISLTSYLTLGKLFNFSELCFTFLENVIKILSLKDCFENQIQSCT